MPRASRGSGAYTPVSAAPAASDSAAFLRLTFTAKRPKRKLGTGYADHLGCGHVRPLSDVPGFMTIMVVLADARNAKS